MKLEEYEEVCPECQGKGKVGCKHCNYKNSVRCAYCIEKVECEKCKGTGKLDWLEMIFGKDPNNYAKYIVKNVCKSDIFIHDLGICINSNSYSNLAIVFDKEEIEKSNDLKNETNSGLLKIVENNMGI